jgi:oxygen-independent coproporphyrinogen III oxidase
MSGLYVHVPFCVRKCPYCAFHSAPFQAGAVEAWLEGIERELDGLPVDFRPDTLFFGGGTPTALPFAKLQRTLGAVAKIIDYRTDPFFGAVAKIIDYRTDPFLGEWTCEANPGTLTAEKAGMLRAAGVNRLSLGAQSFDDATLRRLGRMHTADDARRSVKLARAAGFDNVGIDLIYGVPGVPEASLEADVEASLALEPEHVSCYCLEIEEGTPFAREAAAGRLAVSDAEQREQFDWMRRRLASAGFAHYEISNFAKPGRECRHNLLYWRGGDYLGLGPSAHSHWQGARWANAAEGPPWARAFEERLAPEAKARETLVMGLRLLAGWGRAEFLAATGFVYDELRGKEIARLADEGALVVEPDRVRLSEDALFVSDSVFAELV